MGRKDLLCVMCSLHFSFKDPTNPLGGRCPLVLKCGHSACEGCIKAHCRGGSVVKCTICGTVSEANKFRRPDELREEFPLSTFDVGQVALKKNSMKKLGDSAVGFFNHNKNMSSLTIACAECKKPAEFTCKLCTALYYCSSCFDKIHSFKAFQHHEKSPLVEIPSAFKEVRCEKHPEKLYQYFCNQCVIYICKQCCFESHLEHSCINVSDKNKEILEKFTEAYEESKVILKHLYATRKKVASAGGEVKDEEALKVEQQVAFHFNRLHGILQLMEEDIMKKLRSAQDNTQNSLATISHDLEISVKKVESILNASKSALDPNNESPMPLFHLYEKLETIKETPCHLVLNNEQAEAKFAFIIDESIFEKVKNHCTIVTPIDRVYELCSNSNLPTNYVAEDISRIADPFAKKPEQLVKESSAKSISGRSDTSSPSLPSSEAKNKTLSYQEVLNRNRQSLVKKDGETNSVKSSDSNFDAILSVKPLTEGQTEVVTICHLITPGNFYIHRKSSQHLLENFRDQLSKFAKNKKRTPTNVELGQMYLVQFSGDKKWYRAVVESMDKEKDTCKIFYIDYGNTEHVDLTMLRELPDKYIRIPSQAIHCRLYACDPVGSHWSGQATNHMAMMSNNLELSMCVEKICPSTNTYEVYLRALNSTSTFQEALVFLNCAVHCENAHKIGGLYNLSVPSVKKLSYKEVPVTKGDTFDCQVTFINTPTNFYAQRISGKSSNGFDLLVDLQTFYSKLKNHELKIYNPTAGMPVAAKFTDGVWYRAIVLEVPAPMLVQVQYVDYGNVETVKWDNVRVLDAKFLKTGVLALKCSLSDVAAKLAQGWTNAAKKAFENMALKKMLQLFVDEVKENIISVILYDTQKTKKICLNGLLVQKGFAKTTGPSSSKAEYWRKLDRTVFSEVQVPNEAEKAVTTSSFLPKCDKTNAVPATAAPPAVMKEVPDEDEHSLKVRVKIVKPVSPGEVHITFDSILQKIELLIEEMTSFYANSEKKEERQWEVNNCCAVFNKDKKKWYRGRIQSISGDNCKVFVKDTVEVIRAQCSELRILEDKFTHVLDGTIQCHLDGLVPPAAMTKWPSFSIDYFIQQTCQFKDFYVSILGELVNGSLPIQLWAKSLKTGGPLDPVKEEWMDLNKGLLCIGCALRDRNSKYFEIASKAGDEDFANIEGQMTGLVQDWFQNNFEVSPNTENEPPQPTTTDNEQTNQNLAIYEYVTTTKPISKANSPARLEVEATGPEPLPKEISIFSSDQEPITDWLPPEPFKSLEFIGLPTYVDYDCAVYLQDIERCRDVLVLLRKSFEHLFQGSIPQPQDLEWSVGEICVAYYEVDSKWYRGRITRVKPAYVEVLFVDYGNKEQLQPEQLRKRICMNHIPIQCQRCLMSAVRPVSHDGKWTLKALDYAHQTLVEQLCRFKLLAPTPECPEYQILSVIIPGGENLISLMMSLHYATYIIDCDTAAAELEEAEEEFVMPNDDRVASSRSIKTAPEVSSATHKFPKHFDCYDLAEKSAIPPQITIKLQYKNLILPDSLVELKISVSVIESSTSMAVTIVECEDNEMMAMKSEFQLLEEKIGKESESLPLELSPAPGLACVGCFTQDDEWYRAEVIDIVLTDNLVKVRYVDYGNVEEIPVERLRKMKEEWMEIPKQSFSVTLHDVVPGPSFEPSVFHSTMYNCLMTPPYTMVIEKRHPMIEVELFSSDGTLAYQPLLDNAIYMRKS